MVIATVSVQVRLHPIQSMDSFQGQKTFHKPKSHHYFHTVDFLSPETQAIRYCLCQETSQGLSLSLLAQTSRQSMG